MQSSPFIRWTIALVGAVAISGACPTGSSSIQRKTEPGVTPVAGPSWLNHLKIKYDDTSMGRGSGRYAGNADKPGADAKTLPSTREPVSLTGGDIFRLNCQACHGAAGTGAPPEIRSVIPAVQGSSLELMRKQLQLPGQAKDEATLRQEAAKRRSDLTRRIHGGGERMPPLAHLSDREIDLLYGYLTELAGATTAPKGTIKLTPVAVGEQLVKGTCHICHDASGPRPSGRALLQGTIPPLATILTDQPVVDFLKKVRSGAPVTMGEPLLHYRGRMPVFDYLRDEEVAAAYLFLSEYPPQP
jgi:mono/diheme cytochrome c family protein